MKRTEASTMKCAVKIPFWVRATPGLTDGSPVLFEDIMSSGSDYWFSVSELMVSDLRVAAPKRRQNDWLAGAQILPKHVELVIPYDGAVMHTEKGYDVVRSRLLQRSTFSPGSCVCGFTARTPRTSPTTASRGPATNAYVLPMTTVTREIRLTTTAISARSPSLVEGEHRPSVSAPSPACRQLPGRPKMQPWLGFLREDG
jgi:hypothetical protein